MEHEAKTFKKVTLASSVADVPSAVSQENASKLEAKSCMKFFNFHILDIYNDLKRASKLTCEYLLD